MFSTTEIKILRFKLLSKLFELDNGGDGSRFLLYDIARAAGTPEDLADQIGMFLKNEGLIEYRTSGPSVAITHKGIKEVERSLSEPDHPTAYFSPVNIITVGSMNGSVIQQGSPHATQAASFSQGQTSDLVDIVTRLRDSIDRLGLDDTDRKDLAAEVDTVEAQLSSSKPKTFVVKACLQSARNILERAAGSLLASEILKHLTPLLGGLP